MRTAEPEWGLCSEKAWGLLEPPCPAPKAMFSCLSAWELPLLSGKGWGEGL